MAGAYLAIGACASALTRNQVIAFIVAAVLCFLFLTSGLEIVLAFFRGWAPAFLVDVIASMSFLTHFANIAKGVIDLKDLIYFASVIGFALFVNVAIVEFRKGA